MLGYDSPRLYFAVPDHYTIGVEFPDYDTAAAYALTKIHEIRDCPGSYTKAWVTARLADRTGDREIARYEITILESPRTDVTFEHQRGSGTPGVREVDRTFGGGR